MFQCVQGSLETRAWIEQCPTGLSQCAPRKQQELPLPLTSPEGNTALVFQQQAISFPEGSVGYCHLISRVPSIYLLCDQNLCLLRVVWEQEWGAIFTITAVVKRNPSSGHCHAVFPFLYHLPWFLVKKIVHLLCLLYDLLSHRILQTLQLTFNNKPLVHMNLC